MADGQEDVTKATMIRTFGKEFSFVGQQQYAKQPSLKKKQSENLPEAPYCVNEFINFLINTRLNLLQIYKDNKKDKTITITQFQEFLKKYHFKGTSPGDIDVVIKFFKYKKEEGKIWLNKIVVYARAIDPSYGKEIGEVADAKASKQIASRFPHAIKRTIKKLSDYVKDNNITKEYLFE